MATLKEHQAAMVDLLANGSAIPASASRLAHAMHDVLEMLQGVKATAPTETRMVMSMLDDATTPGLNDKALSKREKTLKTDSPAKWPTPAEQRVKELENTIKQLKANNAKLRAEIQWLKAEELADAPKCACLPEYYEQCDVCGPPEVEQAGCRKPDTQACEHTVDWKFVDGWQVNYCTKCGATGL